MEMLVDSVSLRFCGFENQFSCCFCFQEHGLKHTLTFFCSSAQLDVRESKGCSHLLLFTLWMMQFVWFVQPNKAALRGVFWVIFDYLGLSFHLLTVPNVLFPVFCPRYLWEALPAQLCGPGDVSLQDLHPSRAAQSCLQGNFHLPGCPLPAL